MYLDCYCGGYQNPKRSKAKYVIFDPLNMKTRKRVLLLAS